MNTLPQPLSRDTFTLRQDRFAHYAQHRLMSLLSGRIDMERVQQSCDLQEVPADELTTVLLHMGAVTVVKPNVLGVSEEEGHRRCFGEKTRRAHSLLFTTLYSGFFYGELALFHGISGHGRVIARRYASLRRRLATAPLKRARRVSQSFVDGVTSYGSLQRKAVALARLEIKYGKAYADIAEADIRILCEGRMCTTVQAHRWIYEMAAVEQEQKGRAGHSSNLPADLEARPSVQSEPHPGEPIDGAREYAHAA